MYSEWEFEAFDEAYEQALMDEYKAALIQDGGEFKLVAYFDPENGPSQDYWDLVGVESGHMYASFGIEDMHRVDAHIEMLKAETEAYK